MDIKNQNKLNLLENERVIKCITDTVKICRPAKITVLTGTKEDKEYINKFVLQNKEEYKLKIKGHSYHNDKISDQKESINIKFIEDIEIAEVKNIMDGVMVGKEMFISFFSFCQKDSPFSIPFLQISDSGYGVHAGQILYYDGYEKFKNYKGDFFTLIHCVGLNETDKIFINLNNYLVYSFNTDNPLKHIGLKKIVLGMSNYKAYKEDWLAENMFLIGLNNLNSQKKYFAGTISNKTAESEIVMNVKTSLIGDEITYFKKIGGRVKALSPMKGRIESFNKTKIKNSDYLKEILTTEREIIFANTTIKEGSPDFENENIEMNSKYILDLTLLPNYDNDFDTINGVSLDGIIYGSNSLIESFPIIESLHWSHGVFLGAIVNEDIPSLLNDKKIVKSNNPIKITDYLFITLSSYIENYLKFVQNLKKVPLIFSLNYDENYYLENKDIYLLWATERVSKKFNVLETPIGKIPTYEDLNNLFNILKNTAYTKDEYMSTFSFNIDIYLEKMYTLSEIYKNMTLPIAFLNELDSQIKRLNSHKKLYGNIYIPGFY